MRSLALAVVMALVVGSAACVRPATPTGTRTVDRTFDVTPGSRVAVDMAGGTVQTTLAPPGHVRVVVTVDAYARSSEDAAELLRDYDVTTAQEAGTVAVAVRDHRGRTYPRLITGWFRRVRLAARLDVPGDVALDLATSGGRVEVRGQRAAETRARTSGGSVRADGGTGAMTFETSGGSIDVGTASGPLSAHTSGGSIRVAYIGPSAAPIELVTSGGSISAGIDRTATLDISADTSGGGVDAGDLSTAQVTEDAGRRPSQYAGLMNGGGGRLRARTSGGSIRLHAAEAPQPLAH
jgi:hypothetical protein